MLRILLLLSLAVAIAPAQIVNVEQGVPAKMRDGVILRADIYRPAQSGRYPVLLQRTPYDKRNGANFGFRAAAAGYVVVLQDTRGRYSSEGDWYPFRFETQDGYDTIEWAAGLPYSNGKVGMFGGSYVGATQMLAAIGHPPHLAGICPVVTASNYHNGWTYQGGAFEQWFNESWTSGLAQDTLNRKIQAATNATIGASTLPLTAYPLFNLAPGSLQINTPDTLAPYFLDWLAHPSFDEYWKRWSIEDHYADIMVPALHVAAWYDIFQGGSLLNYQGIKAHGGNDAARKGQHLLVVIGGHAGGGRKIGDVDFGEAAAEFDEDNVTLEWYDYLFKGIQNRFARKPVQIFVMGLNQWREEDEWPLSRARNTKYFLHSEKGANSLGGDGRLTTEPGGAQTPDHYTYDPSNPVPTIGGPLCCDAGHLGAGPRDQRPVESREDVLVYSTAPLENDLEVTGHVTLEMFAKSSVVDTDFTAKLVDVWPNGFAQNLTEGIVRARYRDSQETVDLLNPGQVYRFTVDLWSTSNVFLKGHQIRLEVSSSNFPRFDRNLNTGLSSASQDHLVSAVNTIYHDADHPSELTLPIVKR